jgi:uncharacterized membrane protein YukC
MDLFNNPMVEAAKKMMTPEQLEEYKRVGEYMYNNEVYKVSEIGSKVKESDNSDLILYATQALKSGGSPYDLSGAELRALIDVYGENWYERFGFEENEVPKPAVQLVTTEQVRECEEKRAQEKKAAEQKRAEDQKKAMEQKKAAQQKKKPKGAAKYK